MLRRFRLMGTPTTTLLTAAALVVSLAPLRAQFADPDPAAATVLVQMGDVSVIKDGSGYKWALSSGSTVSKKQTIKTGGDGYAKFRVSDGSIFEVFPNSEVVFRNTSGFGDLLNVWIGRVKVYIQHLPGGNPNKVTSPTAIISVRGTVFDVKVEDEDGTTLVSVDEGRVEVQHLIQQGNHVFVNPGESVRIWRNQPLLGRAVDKGGGIQKGLEVLRQAIYEALYRNPGRGTAGGGTGPVGTGAGGQGDKGKGGATGTGNGTPPGNGAPAGNGAPPSPPPPPPGGGG
jgi:hypothetical protein